MTDPFIKMETLPSLKSICISHIHLHTNWHDSLHTVNYVSVKVFPVFVAIAIKIRLLRDATTNEDVRWSKLYVTLGFFCYLYSKFSVEKINAKKLTIEFLFPINFFRLEDKFFIIILSRLLVTLWVMKFSFRVK